MKKPIRTQSVTVPVSIRSGHARKTGESKPRAVGKLPKPFAVSLKQGEGAEPQDCSCSSKYQPGHRKRLLSGREIGGTDQHSS
jgi:hypothetical protein